MTFNTLLKSLSLDLRIFCPFLSILGLLKQRGHSVTTPLLRLHLQLKKRLIINPWFYFPLGLPVCYTEFTNKLPKYISTPVPSQNNAVKANKPPIYYTELKSTLTWRPNSSTWSGTTTASTLCPLSNTCWTPTLWSTWVSLAPMARLSRPTAWSWPPAQTTSTGTLAHFTAWNMSRNFIE